MGDIVNISIRNHLTLQAGVGTLCLVLLAVDTVTLGVNRWIIVTPGVLALIASTTWIGIRLTSRLTDIHQLASALRDGDFTQRLETDSKDEFADVAQALNGALNRLRRSMRSIEKAADNLDEFTEKSSQQASESASLVDEQNDKIELIATAMEEMTTTIGSVSEDVQITSSRAERIGEQAATSQASLDDLMTSMEEMAHSVKRSAKVFDRVEEQAKGIDQILEVITGVAEQTNLLALNAAIEAARAGEHGRGFAVVADEVRSLAQRTQSSVTEISDMTQQLSNHINEASDASDNASEQTVKAISMAKATRENADQVLESIQEIADRMNSVASAVEEQRAVAVDVSSNINELSTLSTRSVELSERSNQSTERISTLASDLNAELDDLTLQATRTTDNRQPAPGALRHATA